MTEFLSLGSSDAQVLALQKFLVSSGYLKATPTGYYGTLTQAAVESFQSAYNIPTVGTVGPLTRAAINSLAGNKVSTSTTQSTTTSIPIIQTPIISGTFSRSLTLGSTGTDVKNLQIFLNTHGFTVSSTGNGSRGYETTYFGLATKAALVKFQEAHASAILTPLGLTHGTGNFGQSTMKVVNNLK
jgi:peptidoglycan hydrolase-like protein with peptidoglycan-binding domain